MHYSFTSEDFLKTFEFATKYFLDPTKTQSGRTSAEPRGFGAVLDAFTRGKLVEIGVKKMMETVNQKKEMGLDFDIKSINEVKDEPDILTVKENGIVRQPNVFVEIKNTSAGDRWLGLTDEQLRTMVNGSKGKPIYTVYVRLGASQINDNPQTADLVGMYLKEATNLSVLKDFSDLNAEAHLEFIITVDELKKLGTEFPKGDLFYETNLFTYTVKIKKIDGDLKHGVTLIKKYGEYVGDIGLPRKDGTIDDRVGIFRITGNFNIYEKQNPKTQTNYIECLEDTTISNSTFGRYELKGSNCYVFNMETVGRDPILKRNNLFLAKRFVYQMMEQGIIQSPDKRLVVISSKI